MPHCPAASAVDSNLLWSLSFLEHRAHCVVTRMSTGSEARVLVDGQSMVSGRSLELESLLQLVDTWHERLCAKGWVPDNAHVFLKPKPDRRAG
jgi:hypothetical protein